MALANLFPWSRYRDDQPRTVFIGDSITAFWSAVAPRWFRPGWINKGVSGDTTAQMLARFSADVLAARPRVVHIMGGTNDLWRGMPGAGAATSIANIGAMIQLARANRIAVVLAAPPPIGAQAEQMFEYPDFFPALRDGIERHARAFGVIHVDYARALARSGALKRQYTTDGIHLTSAGYRAMRGHAEAAIRKAAAATQSA
ncbi:GDSL-type esterase/lipase family protein [Sphingomonas nostoxanthinifaciens]|uniref:GDSL-type esterase/lipase family protein n=1 Tax=Sphingomonas nostoxanthinifaciens TaxID=2872652 RepID=UPI001CC1F1A6|nr:GDSL-type esterase/lipase family protein [Sphingomonas nostoxanthinifaciens]UAK25041.1 GDSL family lipase [Sphingomonas nostoxanthinifaciens]